MRRRRRNPPPIPYEDYRTGLTFEDVRHMLSIQQDAAYEAGQYMFVSRATVLGRWWELKQAMYAHYAAAEEGLPF